MSDYTIRTCCRLCGGELSDPLVDFGVSPLANEYPATAAEGLAQDRFPLYLVQCEDCKHVQLPVVVDPMRLFNSDYAYSSSTSPVFRAHLDGLANEIAERFPGVHTLEIGSNDGYLVSALRKRSCSAVGVDPCSPPDMGHRTFFTDQLARTLEPVDLVLALNVFAHVDDLDDMARGVSRILGPDGLFVFEVGYLPDVLDRGLFDVIYHEHLSYHHLRPLVSFFEGHGLYMTDALRVDSQGGSVRVWVSRSPTAMMTPRLLAMLEAEEAIDPGRLIKKIGRTLIPGDWPAFGAPAKLTTLMIGAAYYPRVVYDDNPKKVGRFMPGTAIPIVPARQILEDNPPQVVVTAWNFFEEIRDRLRSWGYRGDIIRPLPMMEVDIAA